MSQLVIARTRLGSSVWHAPNEDEDVDITLCDKVVIGYQDAISMRKRETFCRACLNKMHGQALAEIRHQEELAARIFAPESLMELQAELDEFDKSYSEGKIKE